MRKNWYHIKCILLSIGTSFGLLAELNIKDGIRTIRINNDSLAIFIIGVFFLWFYEKFLKENKKNRTFQFFSFLFSFFLVFGYSYDVVGSALLVNKNLMFLSISIIKFISFYYMFKVAFLQLYQVTISYKIREKVTNSKVTNLFLRHPFLFSFLFILVCYLPYLIAFSPTIMCNDPVNQIKEVMGIHTRYMDSVILLDPNMTITNFNPILHTLLIGGCFKLGYTLGSVNLGLFLYTIIQMTILVAIFAYTISYLKRECVPTIFLWITLLVFAFVPVFPFYALSTVKDTLFSAFILLYVIQIYDVIKYDGTRKKYIFLFITSLLVILLRNNGIYTILLSMPFLLISEKSKRKPILGVLLCLILFYIGYGKVLLPSLKISNTSIREVLSIPFQQTARVVKYHKDEIPKEEVEVIDYILDFDTLGERYESNISDPVKDRYNKETTTEELKEYFKVWFHQFFRYPVEYFDATISNVYGYFYPNTSKWYIYTSYNTRLESAGFGYHFITPEWTRSPLAFFGKSYPYIPIIGMLANIGFVVWVYFILLAFLLVNKKLKYLPVLLPAFSLILVCIASPVNTYFRYAQPYVFALVPTVFLLYQILTKEKKKYLK